MLLQIRPRYKTVATQLAVDIKTVATHIGSHAAAAAARGVVSAAVQRAAALRGGLAEGGVVALLASHLMTRGISFRQSKLSTARYSTTQRHAAERWRQIGADRETETERAFLLRARHAAGAGRRQGRTHSATLGAIWI